MLFTMNITSCQPHEEDTVRSYATDGETEAQGGKVTHPGSRSLLLQRRRGRIRKQRRLLASPGEMDPKNLPSVYVELVPGHSQMA